MSTPSSRAIAISLAMIGLVSGSALAGANRGGAMIVHTIPVQYRTINDYCNDGLFPPPTSCEDAVTRCDTEDWGAVMWVCAAFPQEASPAVNGYQFGIYHNLPPEAFTYWAPCGPGVLEIPDPYWPQESGTGTACAYHYPLYPTSPLKMYWFIVDGFEGAYIGTGAYPGGPHVAQFCDDQFVTDDCFLFGTMRWRAPGENQCPGAEYTGACCLPDDTCTYGTPADCVSLGGSYQGDGVQCDPNPCPGICACCFSDGGCELLPVDDCAAHGGLSHPGETCATFDCPFNPPPAACCFEDGRCEMLTPPDCEAQGGIYHWDWTCDPNVCPNPPSNGACCVGEQCYWVTQEQCQAQGGDWMGETVVCEPNPCIPMLEACCFPDGHCEDLTADHCLLSGGTPQGPGTDCDSAYCIPTPTKETTWGRIKSSYR